MSLKETPRLLLESLFDAWQLSDFEEMAALVQPSYLKILDRHELEILERIRNTLGLTKFGAYSIKSISQGLLPNMQDADVEIFDACIAGKSVQGKVVVHVNVIEEPVDGKRGWSFNPVSALRRTVTE